MSSPLELNGPVGIPNSNIFHHMKTVILFAMMVAVICVQSIEIESVQVCFAPQEFQNVKKNQSRIFALEQLLKQKYVAEISQLFATISMENVMQTVSELFIGSI